MRRGHCRLAPGGSGGWGRLARASAAAYDGGVCGRFSLATPAEQIAELFALPEPPELAPRYNIAPGQAVLTVRQGRAGGRQLVWVRWGLVPSWSKDPRIGNRLINARVETVGEKPAFRSALRLRRCLVPADGFYEWRQEGQRRQPYFFSLPDGGPFAFAGLWEHWESAGTTLESCAILTTTAVGVVATVHERMPVIVAREAYEWWLDTATPAQRALEAVQGSSPAAALQAVAVGALVNNPAHDVPEVRRPIG